MTAYQTLGVVDQLIAEGHDAFEYPEAATVVAVLSDGSAERNYVLQGGALTVRQARRSWVVVPTADMHTIRGYASSKAEVLLTEEDDVSRTVIVLDFGAKQRFVGYWDVSALLLETADPTSDGS